ncbi:flippase [Flavobacterium sp. SUN052]|uniref:flippase n=1 Tax=Flavobacterium sp. SUN052 TaxID=3002441 RepID=UPI00237DC981|nr:flippase [Flavobacterium sp. SUN052]MEC4003519.1 flippase [Flavobacterium sp. SUN052]
MIKKLFLDKEIISDILKKGGITFLFRMIAMVLSFLTISFITNFFGKENFGSYSLSLTVLQMVVMVFAVGTPYAFVSFTGGFDSHEKAKGLLIKTTKIILIISVFPMFFFLFGAQFLAQFLFSKPELTNYFKIISLSIPFMILHELLCYYFISIKKTLIYSLITFIFPNVLFLGFLAIIYFLKLPNYLILLCYTTSFFVSVLIGFLIVFSGKKSINPMVSSKEILKKSFPMMVSGIFLILLNWTDILMLGRLETASNIGIYNAAFKVGYLALFFVVSMNVVVMPKISELYHKKDNQELKKVVNRATQIVILLTVPTALILILFSKSILGLFGSGFQAGSTTLILITLGALFNAMTGNVDQILNMTNNQHVVKNIFFIGFILNVLLNLYLIPKYGIEGAATSSLITNILVNSIFVVIIKKKLGFYTFI